MVLLRQNRILKTTCPTWKVMNIIAITTIQKSVRTLKGLSFPIRTPVVQMATICAFRHIWWL